MANFGPNSSNNNNNGEEKATLRVAPRISQRKKIKQRNRMA